MKREEWIEIRGLQLPTYIGVPDEERESVQELRLTLKMSLEKAFAAMNDLIEETVDYAVLASELQALALERSRCLIETLAEDIAGHVLEKRGVRRVEISLEKFILPDAACVAVHLSRERG